jgi:hypothetical protein
MIRTRSQQSSKPRHLKLLVEIFASLFLLLALDSCSIYDRNKVSTRSQEKAGQLTGSLKSVNQQPNEAELEQKGERLIYIDASQSIKGFAGANSGFRNVINALGDEPRTVVYRYGFDRTALRNKGKNKAGKYDDLTVEKISLDENLDKPEFYSLSHNPDHLLFEHINQSRRNDLYILVSDGVYSALDKSQSSIVFEPLTKWLDAGGVLGVLAFRSPYKGSIYSEVLAQRGNDKEIFETGQGAITVPVASSVQRSFYAFVFSRTYDDFKDLQEKLKLKFEKMETLKMETFVLWDEGVEAGDVRFTNEEELKGGLNVLWPSTTDPRYYWKMFSLDVFPESGPAELKYEIPFTIAPGYPAQKIKLRGSVNYFQWDGNTFVESSNQPSDVKVLESQARARSDKGNISKSDSQLPQNSSAPQASVSPSSSNEATTEIILRLPRDLGCNCNYSFYQLKLTPNADLLESVRRLSTDDDSNPANASKTYRFAELMEALLQHHVKTRLTRKLSPPIFLTVASR